MNRLIKIFCCLLLLFPFSVSLYAKHKKKKKAPMQQNAPQSGPLFIPAYSLNTIINLDSKEIREAIGQFPSKEYQIFKTSNQESFYVDKNTNDLIKKQIKKGNTWETHLKQLIQQYVKPGSTVLDIGAHIGTHTVTLSKSVGPGGSVVAFEPQPKIFRELFLNMALNNLSNVSFFWGGVGNKMGKIELSPLVPDNEAGTGLWGGTGKFVDLVSIDSFHFNNVSLMKIDVEGQELAVLEGAKETILRERPVILIEIQGGYDSSNAPPQIREMIQATIKNMEDLGYHVEKIIGHDYLALPKAQETINEFNASERLEASVENSPSEETELVEVK